MAVLPRLIGGSFRNLTTNISTQYYMAPVFKNSAVTDLGSQSLTTVALGTAVAVAITAIPNGSRNETQPVTFTITATAGSAIPSGSLILMSGAASGVVGGVTSGMVVETVGVTSIAATSITLKTPGANGLITPLGIGAGGSYRFITCAASTVPVATGWLLPTTGGTMTVGAFAAAGSTSINILRITGTVSATTTFTNYAQVPSADDTDLAGAVSGVSAAYQGYGDPASVNSKVSRSFGDLTFDMIGNDDDALISFLEYASIYSNTAAGSGVALMVLHPDGRGNVYEGDANTFEPVNTGKVDVHKKRFSMTVTKKFPVQMSNAS
jgi:predicted RecA/RadA family phage recombinase